MANPVTTGFGGFALDPASGSLSLATGGLTAGVGGGQGNAVPLTSLVNRFSTVTTAGDSALLPTSNPGEQVIVANGAATNSMNVFPKGTDQINNLGASAAFAVAAGKAALFACSAVGQWATILSA